MALRRTTRFSGGLASRSITVSLPSDFPLIGGGELDIDLPDFGGGGDFTPAAGFPCKVGFMLGPGGVGCVPIPGTGTPPTGLGLAADDDPDCGLFRSRDRFGNCVLDLDPGEGTGLPGGANGGAAPSAGLTRPRATSRRVLECPTFADGRKGILWMNALTGAVICLPRRTSGKGFGLIRKNPPRQKAFISAADKRQLTKISSVQKKAKKFAMDAGFACKKR